VHACPSGSAATTEGAFDKSQCTQCAPGTWSATGRLPDCLPCGIGYVCALEYYGRRVPCGVGASTSTSYSTSAIDCFCREDWYRPSAEDQCAQCPFGSNNYKNGSLTEDDCLCNPGTYWLQFEGCPKCSLNFYCPGNHFAQISFLVLLASQLLLCVYGMV
jgi:hypothetical protein